MRRVTLTLEQERSPPKQPRQTMYTAHDQRRRKSTVAKPDTHYDELTITAMQQSAIGFEESDKDGSGTLSFDEFSKLLVNVHHVAATGTKLNAWFQ
eukprot:1756859-Prymnesium_polylepis.1